MNKIRGEGRIFQRGAIWWVAYSRNGHEMRESSQSKDERDARKLLRRRLEELKKPEFVGPAEKKLDLNDLEKKLKSDYTRHGRKSWTTVTHCLKPVKAYFGYDRLLAITASRIEAYQDCRLKEGRARATVNREVRYLLHGFRLLFKAHEISYVPEVKLLEGENVREGFTNRPEFEELVSNMKVAEPTKDIVRFLYCSAWRSSEAKSLEWSKVDMHDWIIRLPRKNSKNKRPRTLVLVGELREIIQRRLEDKRFDCPYVFHRHGKQIKSFRRGFISAAKHAGLAGLTPHDLRRSAVRNFLKAGLGEAEGMSISGHETNSTYKRYGIIDENLQRHSLERVHEQQQREIEERKVVPIRRAG
jgi:integrase